MDKSAFVSEYPLLMHMAEAGSWDSIKERGLLSTSALLDMFEIAGEDREQLEARHRPESVAIHHPVHGTAVIRDQKPMSDSALEKCLIDMTPFDWYRLLNSKVFFWVSPHRLDGLLAARAYRDSDHDVLTVDTERLLEKHEENVTLCPYNSGSTIMSAVPRGTTTFSTLENYPYELWRKRRGRKDAVVELAVNYSVPDVAEFVVRVERRKGPDVVELIWDAS